MSSALAPRAGQLLGELGGCARTCGQRAAHAVVAGVEPLLHGHDAHADLLVAGEDGPLDGGRPAPARKQGPVHVQAAEGRQVEHLLGENRPVGRHADDIGRERGELREHRGVAQRARRSHGKTAALGHFLHRGGYERLSPAAHGVGTRVDGRDLVELRQLVQDFRREAGRSHEDDAHCYFTSISVSPGRAPAALASS